jgi:hypothetical protein
MSVKDSGLPAAAGVVDLAQRRGDLTALGRAVVVELFQCLALVGAGEPGSLAEIQRYAARPQDEHLIRRPGGTALSTWAR